MSLILLGILNSQAAGGGGVTPAYDLLETQILTGSAASVTFTGLGSYTDYKHLQIRATIRGDRAANDIDLWWQVNGDTGSNYVNHAVGGTGSIAFSEANTSRTNMRLGKGSAANGGSDTFSAVVADVLDFSNTNKNTVFRVFSGLTNPSFNDIRLTSGLWLSTAAVTSISVAPESATNFVTGSRFSLMGVK